MQTAQHDFVSDCFNATKAPQQVIVCQDAPMGNKGVAYKLGQFFATATYHLNVTRSEFGRLFDMTATKKKVKVEVVHKRPSMDPAYYLSAEFEEKHIASMEGLSCDSGYLESLEAWNVTVGDGLAKGDSY